VLLGSGIGIGWGLTRGGSTGSPSATRSPLEAASPVAPSRGNAEGRIDSGTATERVAPAVVDVNTILASPVGEQGAGAGTGMLISSSGQVLTNNHVIEGATRITVTVEGRFGVFPAKVAGADPTDDVAVLQIQGASGLPTVTLGDSSALRVGQEVVAIGNAFGRGGSPAVSQGTVSGLGRSVSVGDSHGGMERLTGLIQTNASIQPGDSGGPLVNAAGQVVGMITAGTRAPLGAPVPRVGFAIPSNTLLPIVNQIRAGRSSSSVIIGEAGFLGVVVRELDRETAARLGLNVTSGVLVLAVNPGSPAEGLGISRNAVITAIDGHAVGSVQALGAAIHQHKPGEDIRVMWVDRAGTHTATATLVSGPAV
jgi:S1-C subfamily serine protease